MTKRIIKKCLKLIIHLFGSPILFILVLISKRRFYFPKHNTIFVSVICHQDTISFLVAVKSLIYASKKNFPIVAFSDGSLTRLDKLLIRLNHIQLISLNPDTKPLNFPHKWQDVKFHNIPNTFPQTTINYFDADVIFFKEPKELLNNKSNILFMQDFKSRYSFSETELTHHLNISPTQKVNTGVFSFPTGTNTNEIAKKLTSLRKTIDKSRVVEDHYMEQTAYSLLFHKLYKSQKITASPLPKHYFLLARNKFLNETIPQNPTCIHYVRLFSTERIVDSLRLIVNKVLFYK